MKASKIWLLILSTLEICLIPLVNAQMNRAPHFILGGDMARFSILEDTSVGTIVYKLQGTDPENTDVSYSISGQYFSVNKHTGDVMLIKPLDREASSTLEVVISITDEAIYGTEANTVSIRREIPVLDVNDNTPLFVDRPYSFSLSEGTKVGMVIYSNISIVDRDLGANSDIVLSCISGEICKTFNVIGEKIVDGQYKGIITLYKPLDYEVQSSYNLVLKATDSNPKYRLSSTVTVAIEVQDIQDQPPVFFNTPYSVSIPENTPPDKKVLTIDAKDGDVENRRLVTFNLENDSLHYFKLVNYGNGSTVLVTSDIAIDRENPFIAENGGIYSINIKATELINNQLPGEESIEQITVVVLDEDDHLPEFNKPVFHLNVSEDIGIGTPLPGLGMVISDNDLGENGRFSLTLRSQLEDENHQFDKWFSIEPVTAISRTPVIIRVIDNSGLDFDKGVRSIPLLVVASITKNDEILVEVASSEIMINILDANDNSPKFPQDNYTLYLSEDVELNTLVANITATDDDSDIFANITYSLRGFGTDKFATDEYSGGFFLINKIDYEKQVSFSLMLEAKDGGYRTSTVNILVLVIDVNDNVPTFQHSEYYRIVREGASVFQPRFFIKATDADSGANSQISYILQSSNSNIIELNKTTGELTFVVPASSHHTSDGQYELRIRAIDHGIVPLFSEVDVYIRVGIPGNQRPVFKGTPYIVTIPESSPLNSPVITVKATDPDGVDSALVYRITTGTDNFKINPRSGLISVSEGAKLDIDETSLHQYRVTVLATDNGVPFPETAQTIVEINIGDINNKPPVFSTNKSYIRHIPDRTPSDTTVIKVEAIDPDIDANIEYTIRNPVKVTNAMGFPVPIELAQNFTRSFRIEKNTGEIKVNNPLNHQVASLVVLTVEARDKNAVQDVDKQFDTAEVTFYVEAIDRSNPRFTVGGWTPLEPIIRSNVPEELPIGATVLQLSAEDSTTSSVNNFEVTSLLPKQIAMDPTGNIVITENIDYETLQNHTLKFSVKAISDDNLKSTDAVVLLTVVDINDHDPHFPVTNYRGTVEEGAKKGTMVAVVSATDGDLSTSPYGFGTIHYSLFGEHAFLCEINNITGMITVLNDGTIDREHTPVLNMMVVAADTPDGGIYQRRTIVSVQIDVLDINDNAPIFSKTSYTMVVLENVGIGTSVFNVSASDVDDGLASIITYEIVNEFDVKGLFVINSTTGEIKTNKRLTGRGRNEPYNMIIRAQDSGEPSLFADVSVTILIGDIVSNDGVPVFVHPTSNEIAYISENSSIRSPVFKVVALDPDDPFTPQGRIKYMFLPNSNDSAAFHIDEDTGIITTRIILDREIKSEYILVIIAKDSGIIPQQASRVLQVTVTDIDDNTPAFKRSVDEPPLEMRVQEEVAVGTKVGSLEAVDIDEGDNAKIGFIIIDGNEDNLFDIEEISDNKAAIIVSKRIDRETIESMMLTVKCFKLNAKPSRFRKVYNKMDFTERQVIIKILDIDDNIPEFAENNITIGIRSNILINSLISTINATDIDLEMNPILYQIQNSSFVMPFMKNTSIIDDPPFTLHNTSGEIRVISSMERFANGYFLLNVSASNNSPRNRKSYALIKIMIVRERNLLKFVFSKTPSEVKRYIKEFKSDVEAILAMRSMQLNIFDTRYYLRHDGSLDLSKTSSCFQILTEDGTNPNEAENQLRNLQTSGKLKDIYQKYNVQSIQRCGSNAVKFGLTSIQVLLLGVGTFAVAVSFFLICFLCCSFSKWKRLR